MKTINTNFRKHRTQIIVCSIIIAWLMMMLAISLDTSVENNYLRLARELVVGEIADEDVKVVSRLDVIDQEETEALRSANRDAVLPVYVLSSEDGMAQIQLMDTVNSAYISGDWSSIEGQVSDNLLMCLMQSDSLSLGICYNLVEEISVKGVFNTLQLSPRYMDVVLINTIEGTETTLSFDDLLTNANLSDYVKERLTAYGRYISEDDRRVIEYIVTSICQTNVSYDKLVTEQRRQQAYDDTMPVYIAFEKDEAVITKDTVITSGQIAMLETLGSIDRVSFWDSMGDFCFCSIAVFICLYLLTYVIPDGNMHFGTYVWLILGTMAASLTASFFCQKLAFAIGMKFRLGFYPIMLVPLLMAFLSGSKRVGYVCCLIVATMSVITPGADVFTFFYWGLSATACVSIAKMSDRRLSLIFHWLLGVLFYSLTTLAMLFMGNRSFDGVLLVLALNAAMVSVTYLVVALLLPLLEAIFNLPTLFKLNELAYGYSKILDKLSKVAPGTYNHSRAVSELAAEGAKAIGANESLARVGGLYHDIGKSEHPEYFTENNYGHDDSSKHESLTPGLSASIIKSHVTDGERLGVENKLPKEVLDIIANHHGTDVIAYFFHEAQKEQSDREEVQRSDFTYSFSEIPSSKECAIVMLADSIEAASRTVVNPSSAKYGKLITRIIMDKISKNQLDNSKLTLDDLSELRQSFINSLMARNHSRVEYPEEASSL